MKNKLLSSKKLPLGLIAISLLVAAGCQAQPTQVIPTAVPTMDPAVIVDMAVQTVEAKLTQSALDNPSPTPFPTATPAPTETPAPTSTPEPLVSPTPSTPDQVQGISAKFLYAVTYPENKTEYVPNEIFGLAMGLRTTVRYLAGGRLPPGERRFHR
jgi:hypothetical protein